MKKQLVLASLAALLSVGCGGHGGGRKSSSASTANTNSSIDTSGTISGLPGGNGTGTGTGGTSTHARVADYGDPSGVEQELLELANRARKDPTAEGKRLGIDLTSYAARPPISYNQFLAEAAKNHTTDMAGRKFYGHVNPDGVGPNGRILSTKFDLHSIYGKDPAANYSENIGAGTNALRNAKEVHDALIVDKGHNPPKHRNIILGFGSWATCREAGFSYNTGNVQGGQSPYDTYITEEFARTNSDKPFVVGTVFEDKDLSGFYADGEGTAGVKVTLRHTDGTEVSTTTATAGGFAFEVLDAGDYTVEISGGSFGAATTAKVTVGTASVKVDGVVGLGVVVR